MFQIITNAATQTELSEIVEKELADMQIVDCEHESWGETADRVEENASCTAESSLAKFLRAAEERWFELSN